MQCFQKDPNLRVTARKLLRHAWIVGCRKADAKAPVAKTTANFNQAVEEVKQWNKALESSETPFRASLGPDAGFRHSAGTPAKAPLALAKPRSLTDAFTNREAEGKTESTSSHPGTAMQSNIQAGDDNWDDDFATAISPSALRLPHLQPHDNFGGLLSSDKLKAFASGADERNDSSNYADEVGGELMTIKGFSDSYDYDSQEKTIRPIRKPDRNTDAVKSHHRAKSSTSKLPSNFASPKARSPPKSKFELPARPDLAYREQSVEDYSDLFVESDKVFDHRVSQAVKKVRSISFSPSRTRQPLTPDRACVKVTLLSFSIPPT
jgi:hypothetical protein